MNLKRLCLPDARPMLFQPKNRHMTRRTGGPDVLMWQSLQPRWRSDASFVHEATPATTIATNPLSCPKHGIAHPTGGCSSTPMQPPAHGDQLQRSRYFSPLRIFFAEDPSVKRAMAHCKSGTIADEARPRLVVAERRRLHSGCVLITLKPAGSSAAFSLSKGR